MASIDIFNSKVPIPEWVARGLEFDRAFSAKVMAGDWRNMKKEDVMYAGSQALLALAVAACGLVDRGPSKPPELLAVQTSIGLINEDIAAKSPASLKKLNEVKTRSGIPCTPQLIDVKSSKGTEELGVCRVTNNGVEGSVIVSRETADGTEIINKPLVGYRQSDGRIIVGYQRSDVPTDVGQVMILFSDFSSHYVLDNGMVVSFSKQETQRAGLMDFIGKLIEPGGVAVAAEIDTPTPTATVTATAIPATPTKDAPTPVLATTPESNINTNIFTPSEIKPIPSCFEASQGVVKMVDEFVLVNPDGINFNPNLTQYRIDWGQGASDREANLFWGGLVRVKIGGEFMGNIDGTILIDSENSYLQCAITFYVSKTGGTVINYNYAGGRINGVDLTVKLNGGYVGPDEFANQVSTKKIGDKTQIEFVDSIPPTSSKPRFIPDSQSDRLSVQYWGAIAMTESAQLSDLRNSYRVGSDQGFSEEFIVVARGYSFSQ
mgnify:FL=1